MKQGGFGVRGFLAVVAAFCGIISGAARAAECDAAPPAPSTLRAAGAVADYAPTLKLCQGADGARIAIRAMTLGGERAYLLADPATLETRLERARCWASCTDMSETALAETRMGRAIARAAEPPPLTRRTFLANAGLTRGGRGGGYLTADLCPSSKPLDRAFLADLPARTPIALSLSGLWLKHHFGEYRWLLDQAAQGALQITWVNHSYSHPFRKGLAEGENFLLLPGYDADREILENERLLIANGGVPSLFFRFPGLISSSALMQSVAAHHLIALGADAWLALNQAPHDGSVILVHVNGNEELGLKIFRHDADTGKLPAPLKPLDEAPE